MPDSVVSRLLTCGLFFVFVTAAMSRAQDPLSASHVASLLPSVEHAVRSIRTQPGTDEEYDYIMTARVRLLLFWASKDDVGGGYIRRGVSSESGSSRIQLLIGSDTAKAPRAINRWGAASEIVSPDGESARASESSTFFGFMKVSNGKSVAEMQKELEGEKQSGNFLFSAILSETSPNGGFTKLVRLASNQDFNIHEFTEAEAVMFDRLDNTEGQLRTIDAGYLRACGRPAGFLSSTSELIDDALAGRRTPISLCYLYNGERYSLELTQVTPLKEETIRLSLHGENRPYDRTYHDLLSTQFRILNEATKRSSNFELLLGTRGSLRGVPLRIRYQPNWWFDVVLNLKTAENTDSAANH